MKFGMFFLHPVLLLSPSLWRSGAYECDLP